MSKGKNPWPEESDYGKLWRKGYAAGRSDAIRELAPALIALSTPTPGAK